ncbi:MAG: 3-oxoacid CoA-transferase subunit B [Deltaproteobacteria bacterium]|nr:3-oxoacid CoA-transferase subunit B [Deltaproteobacteria bacterium]
MTDSREFIAARTARFLKDGDVVNLGIGIPTLVANYAPNGAILHCENGLIGLGPKPIAGQEDKDFFDAGGGPITLIPGASVIDSASSWDLVRGGHISVTVLGALQVDEKGNLANWARTGKMVGMGGAMDLVSGAREVIVTMEHIAKNGSPKIMKQCTLPLTGAGVVTLIVTELAVLRVMEGGVVLKEKAPGVSIEEIQSKTEARLNIPGSVPDMLC